MRNALITAAAILATSLVFAQEQPTGFPPYGSFDVGQFDAVNLANLNVHFSIPIMSLPGRGTDFSHAIVYDSLIWKIAGNPSAWSPVTDGNGIPTWGWRKEKATGSITWTKLTINCPFHEGQRYRYFNYKYVDPIGTSHTFALDISVPIPPADPAECAGGATTGFATDGSGYYLDAADPEAPVVYWPGGVKVATDGTLTDTNGNYITKTVTTDPSYVLTTWTDTRGKDVLKIKVYPNSVIYQVLDKDGNYQSSTLTLASRTVATSFGCSGISEFVGNSKLPTSLQLPNGQTYTFTYEPGPPQYFQSTTGRLRRVTLPTGGYYEYTYPGSMVCADASASDLWRSVSDGTTTSTWMYTRYQVDATTWQTYIQPPVLPYDTASNEALYTFTSGRETERAFYSGPIGGTPLQRIQTAYPDPPQNCSAVGGPAVFPAPKTRTVILQEGNQSKTETDYDCFGNLLESREYGWGPGPPGAVVRTTTFEYLTTGSYPSKNIRNRVTKRIAKEGGPTGAIKSQTDIAYDGGTLTDISEAVLHHDDASYGPSFTTRGNPTSVTNYVNVSTQPPSEPIVKSFTYDELGNLRQADADCCQEKEWVYSSPNQYQYAYPDQIKSGPPGTELTTSTTYSVYNGAVLTRTDENNKVTAFNYDDVLGRLTKVTRPDSKEITYEYSDSARTVTSKTPISSTTKRRLVTNYDGLGRPFKTTTTNESGSTVYSIVETQYDTRGRSYKVSNPYTSTPQYWSETRFDGLGRPAKVFPPGTTSISTYYTYSGTGRVTVTDLVGKERAYEIDALGRMVKAIEPDANNVLNQETNYTYTTLDGLDTVTQGAQTRTYHFDGLGRLKDETTPEAGTVNYLYNSFGLVTQRTDARGVETHYDYDDLNRLERVSYEVPLGSLIEDTEDVTYEYGTDPVQNNNGRLVTMTDGTGSESYSYGVLGLVTQVEKTISGEPAPYIIEYGYNDAGEVKSITYPSGREVEEKYDAIGRLNEVKVKNGASYVNTFGYNAAGQLTGLTYGNDVTATLGYSSDRLQLTSLTYAKTGQNLLSLAYGYDQGAGKNNGQIAQITDNVDARRTVSYTYDALGRLSTAVTQGNSNPYWKWGLGWVYDRYGNLLEQNKNPYPSGSPPTYSYSVAAGTNRINGFAYDSNGNMTNDGTRALVYDAADRLISSTPNGGQTTSYSYDGNALRVKKLVGASTTVYFFSGAKVIAEHVNGTLSREYIYSGNRLVATHEGSTLKYHHADRLSARMTSDTNGALLGEQGHYPFGETWYLSNSTTKWQFTSYERDESGMDYAIFRYHSPTIGRFLSPDMVAGSITDPQSLNRYSYVRSDPVNLVDPLGLMTPNCFDPANWGNQYCSGSGGSIPEPPWENTTICITRRSSGEGDPGETVCFDFKGTWTLIETFLSENVIKEIRRVLCTRMVTAAYSYMAQGGTIAGGFQFGGGVGIGTAGKANQGALGIGYDSEANVFAFTSGGGTDGPGMMGATGSVSAFGLFSNHSNYKPLDGTGGVFGVSGGAVGNWGYEMWFGTDGGPSGLELSLGFGGGGEAHGYPSESNFMSVNAADIICGE